MEPLQSPFVLSLLAGVALVVAFANKVYISITAALTPENRPEMACEAQPLLNPCPMSTRHWSRLTLQMQL